MRRTPVFWMIVTAALLAGCGKEKTEEAAGGPVTPPTAPKASAPTANGGAAGGAIAAADLDKVGKATTPYKLALIVKTRNNPFFDPMIKAAEQEAKELAVELDVQAPPQETDKEKQFALVEDEIAKGVQAILIAPADSKAIVPALKKAQEKGILVVNLDNRVDEAAASAAGVQLGGFVGADNQEGGRMAGEAMVKALTGKGKVAVLEGIRGADNAEARKRGFTESAKGKLAIVASDSANWDTKLAYDKFQSMLAANKDLSGVFCANDKMALGALKAIQEAGQKGKIVVVGFDNIGDVQPYLKSGEMTATIEQHPDLMGRYGVKMAVGILGGSVPKGKEFFVPLEVIGKK